jgi:hypothetical protein
MAGSSINRHDVELVIRQTNAALRLIEQQNKKFKGANDEVKPASFASYPGATVVVTAHTNAHTEATATLTHVTGTLTTFADNLQAVLDDVDEMEELTSTAFNRIVAVSEAAVSGTSTTPGDGPFVMNDQDVPRDAGQDAGEPNETPEVCTPEEES